MSRQITESIAKNTVVMFGSQIITWASSFVLMLFLPRYLGSTAYGYLFLALSIAAISQIIIQWGGHYYITKHVARDKGATADLFVNSVTLRVFVWAGILVATLVFVELAGYPPVVKFLVLIFTVSKVWEESNNVLQRCFQGHELMRYPAIGNVTERVFLLIAAGTAIILGGSVVIIGGIMAAATLLNFAVCIRFMPKVIEALPRVNLTKVATILRESTPYFLYSLFGVIYYRIDAVMLSFMAPEVVVGWYGAAYRFFDIIMFLPSIYNMAVFPVISRLWHDRSESLALTVRKSMEFILLVGIPLSIGGVLFSNTIVTLFYGVAEYGPAIGLLQVFFVGILLVYINFILMPLIFASDRQRIMTIIAFAAMLLNPLLNYFLIPYFQARYGNGGFGAAFATLITEYFLLVCSVLVIPKDVFTFSNGPVLAKGVLAGAVMAAAIYAMRQIGINWGIQIAVGGGVYLGVLLLVRAVTVEEIRILVKALGARSAAQTIQPAVE